jgi:hypothetical protein
VKDQHDTDNHVIGSNGGKISSLYEPSSKYETEKHIAYRDPKSYKSYAK